MKQLWSAPHPFFEGYGPKLWITIGVSVFVVLFLWIFKPFGIVNFSLELQSFFITGSGLVCFGVLAVNHFLLPYFLPNVLQDEGWTVGRHILWLWWQLISVGLGNYTFALAAGILALAASSFLFIMFITFAIGIFPIAVIVLISYLVLYKRRLHKADPINQKLKKIKPAFNEPLCLTSEIRNEKVECNTEDFLYAESKDNYAYICHLENREKKGTMLRSTLKRLEEQLPQSWIVRCHRSYIVNLQKVESIKGNAQGYKLILDKVNMTIPVSRSKHKNILALLKDM